MNFEWLEGRGAIVTGGGSGIGQATAEQLAKYGAKVVLIGRTKGKLDVVLNRIHSEGSAGKVIVADLRYPNLVDHAIEAAAEWLGTIDIMVNSAGIYREGSTLKLSDEDIDNLVDVNFKGTVFATRSVLPRMKLGACIINIASMSGVRALNEQQSLYAATKAAVIHFSACLAREVASKGIRVNVVSPGPTETPILRTILPEEKISGIQDLLASEIPLGRLGQAQEIAEAVAYLAIAQFATGAHLVLDGGASL